MEFSHFLSSYFPDPSYGGKRLFADMVEQATTAERLGSPIEESREKFDESLGVLIALLTREDVGWSGKYYDFEPLTIMPRPLTRPRPRMMIASVSPQGISAMTRRGFDIQTTPLAGDDKLFMRQVGTHKEAKAEMGAAGEGLRIMMSRIIYCARDAADARDKLERTHEYYKRFHNVREPNPAVVTRGCIEPLPYRQTLEELDANLIVCPPAEMIDRLAPYHEAGIDEFILSSNLGQPQEEHIEAMERFAAQVMSYFAGGGETDIRETAA